MRDAFIVCAVTLMATATACADTFRCPNGNLVSTGDSLSEVVVKCDQPTFSLKRIESEDTGRRGTRIIEVEEWTYNQGPHTLVHHLVFRNGVLVEVRTGTFGR